MPPPQLGIDKNERMRCLLNKLNGVDERIGVIPHNKTRRDESEEESGHSHPSTHSYDFKDNAKNRHTHPRPKKEPLIHHKKTPVPDVVIHHENKKMEQIRNEMLERGSQLIREELVKNLKISETEHYAMNIWDVPMRNACIDVLQMLKHDFVLNTTKPLPVSSIRELIDSIQPAVEELTGYLRNSDGNVYSDHVKQKIRRYIELLERFSFDFFNLLRNYQLEYDEILSQYYRSYTKKNWTVTFPVSRYPENVQPRMKELIVLITNEVRKWLDADLKDKLTFPLHDQDPENQTLVFEFRDKVQRELKYILDTYYSTKLFSGHKIRKQLALLSRLCESTFYKEHEARNVHRYTRSFDAWDVYKRKVTELYYECELWLTEYSEIEEKHSPHSYRKS
jgi:hypothetical protein